MFLQTLIILLIPVAHFCVDNVMPLLVSFIVLLNAMDLMVPVNVSVADQESVTTF